MRKRLRTSNSPDDQTLSAPAVSRGEDTGNASDVLVERRLDVGPAVLLEAESLDGGFLGAEESKREEDTGTAGQISNTVGERAASNTYRSAGKTIGWA